MKWIKCSERLPEPKADESQYSKTVMISDGEHIGIGYYEYEYNIEDDPDAFEGQTEIFSDAVWHSDVEYLNRDCCGWPEVTHWAEMPNPPD